MEELKLYLKAGPQNWLYGEITENMFLQGCMDMDLTEKRLQGLKKSFEMSKGLPWDDLLTHENLETVLISRLDQLRNWLPYFEIESVSTNVRFMSFGRVVEC